MQTDQIKNNLFIRKSFYKFFLPSLLSCLGIAVGGLADCIFVGNVIGTAGLTAISIGQPVYMLFNTISYSLSIGGSIHYASVLGEGKEEEGNRIFANVLRTDLILNILICALGLIFLPQVLTFLGAGTPGTEVWATSEALVRAQLLLVPIMFCQGPFYYFINCDNDPKLAAVCSSSSRSFGVTRVAMSRVSACRCPPESSPTGCFMRSSSPISSKASFSRKSALSLREIREKMALGAVPARR